MSDTNEHRIGELLARVVILEQTHLRLESKIERQLQMLNDKIGNLHEVITTAKGSWRAILIIGGILATVSTIAASFIGWLRNS